MLVVSPTACSGCDAEGNAGGGEGGGDDEAANVGGDAFAIVGLR